MIEKKNRKNIKWLVKNFPSDPNDNRIKYQKSENTLTISFLETPKVNDDILSQMKFLKETYCGKYNIVKITNITNGIIFQFDMAFNKASDNKEDELRSQYKEMYDGLILTNTAQAEPKICPENFFNPTSAANTTLNLLAHPHSSLLSELNAADITLGTGNFHQIDKVCYELVFSWPAQTISTNSDIIKMLEMIKNYNHLMSEAKKKYNINIKVDEHARKLYFSYDEKEKEVTLGNFEEMQNIFSSCLKSIYEDFKTDKIDQAFRKYCGLIKEVRSKLNS